MCHYRHKRYGYLRERSIILVRSWEEAWGGSRGYPSFHIPGPLHLTRVSKGPRRLPCQIRSADPAAPDVSPDPFYIHQVIHVDLGPTHSFRAKFKRSRQGPGLSTELLSSQPPSHPSSLRAQLISLEDLRGGPHHQGRDCGGALSEYTSSSSPLSQNPPAPQPPSPGFPGTQAAGVRVLAHRLALPRYSGSRRSEIRASSAECRGARGGNQDRRARGLPSARMSAGAGSRSVWRVAAPAACAARGPSPAVAGPVACRRRARCASLPQGRPAR